MCTLKNKIFSLINLFPLTQFPCFIFVFFIVFRLNTIPPTISKGAIPVLSKLFDSYVPSVLPHLRRNFTEPLPTVNNCLVEGKKNWFKMMIFSYILFFYFYFKAFIYYLWIFCSFILFIYILVLILIFLKLFLGWKY